MYFESEQDDKVKLSTDIFYINSGFGNPGQVIEPFTREEPPESEAKFDEFFGHDH